MTTAAKPRQGETYRCQKCGLEIQVTSSCDCNDDCAELQCCGEALVKK